MTAYIVLFIIITFIYFVLIRNKPIPKTDWETLPFLDEYKTLDKAINESGECCCRHCQSLETVTRSLQSEQENPNNSKFYHACTKCKIVLWRSEANNDEAKTQ